MPSRELQAELCIKMVELERAIDQGLPYAEIKFIYQAIKQLQYKIVMVNLEKYKPVPESAEVVIE